MSQIHQQQQQQQSNGKVQPTVIGAQCRLVGDLSLDGDAVILGAIEGEVEISGHLEIGIEGLVVGSVRTGSLNLLGRIEGDVTCTQTLTLGTTATLLGNLFATAFNAEHGATCRGHVVIGPQAVAAATQQTSPASASSQNFAARHVQQIQQHEAMANAGLESSEVESYAEVETVGRIDQNSPSTLVGTNPGAVAGLIRRRPSLTHASMAPAGAQGGKAAHSA